MKKSFPVHIEGRIYYFDEDAYERLNSYYNNLRQTFTDEDGAEIVADIEARVAEIFSEKHPGDCTAVVTIYEVNDLITRMGKPEELAEESDEPTDKTVPDGAVPPPYKGTPATPPEVPAPPRRRLYRDNRNKVIAGVLSGLAHYWSVNVTALRIAVVILAVCTWVWPLIMLYVVAWLLIPAAVTPRQMLEMNGQHVTVDSIGRTTIFGSPESASAGSDSSFWSVCGRILGIAAMSFIGFIGGIILIAMVVVLITSIVGIITFSGWGILTLVPIHSQPFLSLIAMALMALAWLIPAGAAVWATCCVLFKAKGVSRRTAIIIAIIEFLLIIAAVSLCTVLDIQNIPKIPIHLTYAPYA